MQNNNWRNSHDNFSISDFQNLPKIEYVNQENHHHLPANKKKTLDITLTSQLNFFDYQKINDNIQRIISSDEKTIVPSSSSSTSSSLEIVNNYDIKKINKKRKNSNIININLQQALEKHGYYNLLESSTKPTKITMDICKLSVNMSIVNTLWLKKISQKNKKKKLTKLKSLIIQKHKFKKQSSSSSSSSSELIPMNFNNRNLTDTCSINLNQLKISPSSNNDLINQELIIKMSSLSCNHDILNHRDSSKDIIIDDVITFHPNLEETLNNISLQTKINDYDGDDDDDQYSTYSSLVIDEIHDIDKISNLSIQDDNKIDHQNNDLNKKIF
ncbi:hypothetical protein HCN44_003049 [Aphidius gifuensis]|uniref:Uncharacterized protein n=1 Tax=Aphidius gifuensis TaxID=684658 RepID=A0A835CKK3_APHGI|nr:putative uncharacterized protein DDB_G0291812 [Aphidius gifuensis]XP_044018671.1 putative uncharacterized protein DDB_G0291812 [Aphidius gifuensis]XP_044018672.1 putative uncharacterized protein DDB_G0291812 [Aphidius gifuensis]KAF7987287.1 hypothetical protein HCN44_003049 [Aphidius gifuensis]